MNNDRVLNDRYQLLRVLGHGGMADVYLAWDHILRRYAAIKILRLDLQNDEQAQRRFQHEAAAIADLNSPYIVKVYDFGEQDHLQYLVMEYVKGTNLKNYLKNNYPLTNQRVVTIMTQIVKAVLTAHQSGIIHRDLKPQNVLIDEQGNAKISDFGISITMSDQTITKTNYVVGSIHYLSPEQVSGRRATKQSDIYSLGIIMFELLTDRVPFDGENAVVIALKHTKESIPKIVHYNPNVTQGLINIVRRATAKRPQDRYHSVKEMLEDLQLFALSDDVKPYEAPEPLTADETKMIKLDDLKAVAKQNQNAVNNNGKQSPKHRFWRRRVALGLISLFGLFMVGYYFMNQTTVPNLNALSYQDATKKLKQHHLRVNNVEYRNDGLIPYRHVITTDPNKNGRVNRIWGVKLILSTGHGKIKLGNYVGQNINAVKEELKRMGFLVTISQASSDYFKRGQILKQNFTPDQSYDPKEKRIHLTVSAGLQQFVMKDLVGMDKDEVDQYVNQVGLNPTYEYRYSDDDRENTVIQQNPTAGLKVYSGDNIIIVLSSTSVKKQDDQDHNVNVNVNIPYVDNGSGSNMVNVYLGDRDHSITKLYRQMRIYQDSKIILPFLVNQDNPGRYQIYRDGQKIMDVGNIQ